MACAVGGSNAHKILVPVSRCQTTIAGLPAISIGDAVTAAVNEAVRRVRENHTTRL